MTDPADPLVSVHLYLEALDDAQTAQIRWRAAALYSRGCEYDPDVSTTTSYKAEARKHMTRASREYDKKKRALRRAFGRMIDEWLLNPEQEPGSTGEGTT